MHSWYEKPISQDISWEKTLDKSQLKDIVQNVWPVFLKTLKIIKIKENKRNCHKQKKPKETQQLNAIANDRSATKHIIGTTGETQIGPEN